MHRSAPSCTIETLIYGALSPNCMHTHPWEHNRVSNRGNMTKWTGQKQKKESPKTKTETPTPPKRPNIDKTMSAMVWREPANLRPRSLRKKRTQYQSSALHRSMVFFFFPRELWSDNLGQILTIGCAPKAIPAKDSILWPNPTLHES